MFLCISLFLFLHSPVSSVFRSYITLSPFGMEFQPRMAIQLLSITASRNTARCSTACNQLQSCRTFDYDLLSKQCRLFEGDSTTGLTILALSLTSIVGTVRVLPSLYTSTYNQPCAMCEHNRYQICSTNTSSCQCLPHTYWNGLICALQLFENDTCAQVDACRSDFNLTCSTNNYGEYQKCDRSPVSSMYNTLIHNRYAWFDISA